MTGHPAVPRAERAEIIRDLAGEGIYEPTIAIAMAQALEVAEPSWPVPIGLRAQDVRLYRRMLFYAKGRMGCVVSQARLAEDLGLPSPKTGGARQVRRFQDRLKAAGWLERVGRDEVRGNRDGGVLQAGNIYRLTGPGSEDLGPPRRARRVRPAQKPNEQVAPSGHPKPQVAPSGQPVESPIGEPLPATQNRRSHRADTPVDNSPKYPYGKEPHSLERGKGLKAPPVLTGVSSAVAGRDEQLGARGVQAEAQMRPWFDKLLERDPGVTWDPSRGYVLSSGEALPRVPAIRRYLKGRQP